MNRDGAVRRAGEVRAQHEVPNDSRIASVDARFIELAANGPDQAGPVRDEYVWVVRFQSGIVWVDLAIADASGEVVRVERSRQMVLRGEAT